MDTEFLERLSFPWEAVLEGNVRWVVVHDFPVCDGYDHSTASAALQLSKNYPDTQIDMVYFLPHLSRTDGKAVAQISNQNFDGKMWQRWSRHRTDVNPWRRDYDCIETHLLLIDEWLERENRIAA